MIKQTQEGKRQAVWTDENGARKTKDDVGYKFHIVNMPENFGELIELVKANPELGDMITVLCNRNSAGVLAQRHVNNLMTDESSNGAEYEFSEGFKAASDGRFSFKKAAEKLAQELIELPAKMISGELTPAEFATAYAELTKRHDTMLAKAAEHGEKIAAARKANKNK